MGQMTHGILYGVNAGNGDEWCGDDGDHGILGEYKEHCKARIDAMATRLGRPPWALEHRFVPDTEWNDHERTRFAGFWISRGASGCGMNGAVLMSQRGVCAKHPSGHARALRRWRRFARFCAAQGFEVPKAQIWLVETEVG